MLTRKQLWIVLLLVMVVLPGCSFSELILPEIDWEETEKSMEEYLHDKYNQEFEVTELKRGCTGFGASCSKRVDAVAFAKEEPTVTFEVSYDVETKECEDNYRP
ncbi:hypothetical protein [Desmospora activa]|uniref:Uncharacterized protein n=1 Tax=Desmospora activa DSM 45169 TaxID=1121389 RepID=A0A2T4Z400_9BACL|nr:hypothetical protein [Desmospora activa]PTM56623.1 hypothetical protein C8J48_2948 [Desmospora activa DSM 45169]